METETTTVQTTEKTETKPGKKRASKSVTPKWKQIAMKELKRICKELKLSSTPSIVNGSRASMGTSTVRLFKGDTSRKRAEGQQLLFSVVPFMVKGDKVTVDKCKGHALFTGTVLSGNPVFDCVVGKKHTETIGMDSTANYLRTMSGLINVKDGSKALRMEANGFTLNKIHMILHNLVKY